MTKKPVILLLLFIIYWKKASNKRTCITVQSVNE